MNAFLVSPHWRRVVPLRCIALFFLGLQLPPTGAARAESRVDEPVLLRGAPAPIRVPSASTAWGGPRNGTENPRSEHVVNYQLKAKLDPVKHTIDGTATITWTNRSAVEVRTLYAHLYLNAFESEGSTFFTEKRQLGAFRSDVKTEAGQWGFIELKTVSQSGQPVPWRFEHPDYGPDTDHTVVRLDLPQAVAPGGSTTLHVTFFDQLPRVVARTGWFDSFHLVGQWYPKIGVLELPGERGATEPRWNCHEFHLNSEFYADFGSYSLEVIVPAQYKVGASGQLIENPTTDAAGTHHRYQVDDVHDVVFTAWDGFATPLKGNTSIVGDVSVTVEVLAPTEYQRAAEVALQSTLDSVKWFSENVGPYPYPKITVVVPPFNATEAGGMEYETFFTTIGGLTPPFNSDALVRSVTVHEFGHGYFSGLLATNEFEEPFLDEGLNEWLDARMLENEPLHLEAPAWLRWLGLSIPSYRYLTQGIAGGRGRFPADPIAAAAWGRWSTGSYGQVYSRTQMAMHDLGVLLGPDVTARAIKLYYQKWHFRHPSTADLAEAFVEAGADRAVVSDWFEQQVYHAEAIDDRVERLETEDVLPLLGSTTDGGVRVATEENERDREVRRLRDEWKAKNGKPDTAKPGAFLCRSTVAVRRYGAAMSRTVELAFADGGIEKLEWKVNEPWRRWELVRPICVASVRLDGAEPLYLDTNLLDNVRTKKRNFRTVTALTLEAFQWLQQAFALGGFL
jgi:hypothetical protein